MPMFNVPDARNPNFVGRSAAVKTMRRLLSWSIYYKMFHPKTVYWFKSTDRHSFPDLGNPVTSITEKPLGRWLEIPQQSREPSYR
ncbi:hypothetical protein HYFRA_00009321 [Hymenoscyphus fraxineus]|uniref:Uncharacterized protein n=1 Tax=Hymenoscyphus fraxineus TaxID=746836 RepID=A0A9N9L3M3_9HELO|nr:hypothetical protein HYFRA_00009321 [Hymenoscyphus fraxineus]